MSAWEWYMWGAVGWSNFCVGYNAGKHSDVSWARLLFVAAINFLFWPVTLTIALFCRASKL